MKSDKSEYQLEVEGRVLRREADRCRLAELMGEEFEALEDESKGDKVGPALAPDTIKG